MAFPNIELWCNAPGNKSAEDNVSNPGLETNEDSEDSFFDILFTAPNSDDKRQNKTNYSFKKDGQTRFNFIDSPNNFFFKRKILPIEPSSKPQSPISLFKSPPKFRVFTLGFKKSKTETNSTDSSSTVKCNVQEVPISSLFNRENISLRTKFQKEIPSAHEYSYGIRKYFKVFKPFYVKVSKRYNGEKMRFSETVTPLASPVTVARKEVEVKQVGFPAGLRVVCKKLAKSRSASSAVAVGQSPAESRRDDSLVQQNDGIQSAILHCKRSYNSSSKDTSVLSRSVSDSFHEKSKSMNPPRISSDEGKRSSI